MNTYMYIIYIYIIYHVYKPCGYNVWSGSEFVWFSFQITIFPSMTISFLRPAENAQRNIYIYVCICKSCGYNACSGSEFVWSVWNMIEVTLRWADMAEIVENLRQKMTFQVLNMFLQYMYKSRL